MSLAALKKQNSLDKLLGAVQSENTSQEKKSYVDDRLWKPVMDKTGMVLQLSVSFQHQRERSFLGQNSGTMHSKVQLASGILRTL